MRWLLVAITAGFVASTPAFADNDDSFKKYYKRLHKQQKRQAEFYRDQQKQYKKQLREQRKRQRELMRDHGGLPHGHPSFYPPQTFGLEPFAPNSLPPAPFHPNAAPYYPNPTFPGFGYAFPYNPPPGYLPVMPGPHWHGDDDDDD